MGETLVNKVANSGLITLRPEEWVPREQPASFDLKDFLFMELILKEKDFREALKSHDWVQYKDKSLCIFCSADAIIPSWAYMLVTTYATPAAKSVFYGTPEQWYDSRLMDFIHQLDVTPYHGERVIIKGCSDGMVISPSVYVALTHKLMPVVKSLMFGEPCSTVPVFKRSKEA
jgi:hypothetical protein